MFDAGGGGPSEGRFPGRNLFLRRAGTPFLGLFSSLIQRRIHSVGYQTRRPKKHILTPTIQMPSRRKRRRKSRYRLGLEISPEVSSAPSEPHPLHLEDGLKGVYRWLELGDRALQDDSKDDG